MNKVEIVHKPTMSEFRRMAEQLGYEKVKHGKWIPSKFQLSSAKCSVCGKTDDVGHTLYCPFCGARMDGE